MSIYELKAEKERLESRLSSVPRGTWEYYQIELQLQTIVAQIRMAGGWAC